MICTHVLRITSCAVRSPLDVVTSAETSQNGPWGTSAASLKRLFGRLSGASQWGLKSAVYGSIRGGNHDAVDQTLICGCSGIPRRVGHCLRRPS